MRGFYLEISGAALPQKRKSRELCGRTLKRFRDLGG